MIANLLLKSRWGIFFICPFFLDLCFDAREFAFKREFDSCPPPFEKIYLCGNQILSMPDGTYIKHVDGTLEKVRAVREDYQGRYYFRVHTQCPLCGRCYSGQESDDGLCCPIYEKEICPGVWE